MITKPAVLLRPLPRLTAVLGILFICLGSTSSSCSWSSSDDDGGGGGNDPSFVTELTLRDANGDIADTFQRGELIEMRLTVRNRLDTAASIEFDTTRTADFVVVQENTDIVEWKWSRGRPFATVRTTLEFAAGETQTFTVTWNQNGDDGAQVRVGTYEARGVLFFSGFDSNPLRPNQLGSTLQRFRII